jgi:hypothetical protein
VERMSGPRPTYALMAREPTGHIQRLPSGVVLDFREPPDQPPSTRRRPGPGHDCRRAGCQAYVCRPMKPSTTHGTDGILSGAFAMAQRSEWIDRNPTDSARAPGCEYPSECSGRPARRRREGDRRSPRAQRSTRPVPVDCRDRPPSRSWAASWPRMHTCSPTSRATPGHGTRTGPRTRSAPRPTLSESTLTSREAATTPPASSSPRDSTGVTPPHASAAAAAVRPHCGTTPIQYLRLTAVPRRTCPASPQMPEQRPRHVGNSSSSRLGRTLLAELVVPYIALSDLLPSCALFGSSAAPAAHAGP